MIQVDYGHEEVRVKWGGDPRRYNTNSKEFLVDENGRVSGVRTVLVEFERDAQGRFKFPPKDVPGTEKIYPAQLILLAMGFIGPEKYSFEEFKLDTERGNIKTPKGQYNTSVENVFAAGDCRRGQSLVVWAITEGRQAAREVDEYLMGSSLLPTVGGIVVPKINQEVVVKQG